MDISLSTSCLPGIAASGAAALPPGVSLCGQGEKGVEGVAINVECHHTSGCRYMNMLPHELCCQGEVSGSESSTTFQSRLSQIQSS